MNQTLILNNVAPSGTYTAQDVTQWSASYTGQGGQLLITADLTGYTAGSALKNYYLKKNGITVVTGSFFFNSSNMHTTLPTLKYIDTSGSISSATWSVSVGSGLVVDAQDRATIAVTEYTGVTSITVDTLTASNNVSGNTLISTNSSLNEGGEIQLAKSPNSTLTGTNVVIDQYVDRIRFFEAGGTTRGVYIDLNKAPAGVSGELMFKASGLVNAGVDVTLGNLKARIPTGGNRSLQVSTVSGTYSVAGSGVYSMGGVSGSTIQANSPRTINTTPAYLNPGYNFGTDGATDTWVIYDAANSIGWRITCIIGPSYVNNLITIERLL